MDFDRSIVVIADCCHKSSSINNSADDRCSRLVRDILGDQYVSSSQSIKINETSCDSLDYHPLHLETKYYTADVGLCVLQSPTIGDQKLAELIEAVILFYSNTIDQESTTFSSAVDPWLSFIQHWEETSIKILACQRATCGSSLRLIMQQWCIKNDFEFIELDPDDETKSEIEDCGEVFGVRRILQALKAHSWSNLEMKDERLMDADRAERLRSYLQENDPTTRSILEQDDLAVLSKNFNQANLDTSSASASNSSKLHSDIDQLLLKSDDPFQVSHAMSSATSNEGEGEGEVSFEELFSKFTEMKETASNLPPEQRKAYAEKVTLAFWNAIGGDDKEIEGIGESSDDDNDDENNLNKQMDLEK